MFNNKLKREIEFLKEHNSYLKSSNENMINFIKSLLKAENELNQKIEIRYYKEVFNKNLETSFDEVTKELITIPEMRFVTTKLRKEWFYGNQTEIRKR